MAFKMYDNKTAMKKLFGDLNKDGKMSSYEQTRQDAIEKNMSPKKMYGESPKKNYMTMGKYSKSGDAVKFGDSPKKMYGESPKKFASDAERKAAYASGYKGKKKK